MGVFGVLGASIGSDNLMIMSIIAAFIAVVLFGTLGTKKRKVVPVYMSGITVDSDERIFKGSLGDTRTATSRNWYLENIFGEKVLDKPITVATAIIMAAGIVASLFAAEAYGGHSFAEHVCIGHQRERRLVANTFGHRGIRCAGSGCGLSFGRR